VDDSIANNKKTYFLETILPSLKFGDIVFAERFNTEKQKKKMGEGHDSGPYIVVGKDNDKIIGCYCTSTENGSGNFCIGEDYELFYRKKNTYATRYNIKTIDYISFMNKYRLSLNNADIKKLLKMLVINPDIKYSDLGVIKPLVLDAEVKLEEGDIFKYTGINYLILEECEDSFLCVPLTNYNIHLSKINFANGTLDFDRVTHIQKNVKSFVNTIPNIHYQIILKRYSAYLRGKLEKLKLKKSNVIERGSLIKTNDKYAYVYGKEANVLNAFLVKLNCQGEDILRISDINFLPEFNEEISVVQDDTDIKVIAVADKNEMDFIKSKRQSYFKVLKKEEKNKNLSKQFEVGNIIMTKNKVPIRYIVISIINENINTIEFDSLVSGLGTFYRSFNSSDDYIKLCSSVSPVEMEVASRKIKELSNKQNKKITSKR